MAEPTTVCHALCGCPKHFPNGPAARLARITEENARLRAYIAAREAEQVTLCCVCEQPVWPSLTLWQHDDGRALTYGHRACLDSRASGDQSTP